MTENTSFTNVNRVDNYRFGWVGPPGPDIEQKPPRMARSCIAAAMS
jgi:hypothetical protein